MAYWYEAIQWDVLGDCFPTFLHTSAAYNGRGNTYFDLKQYEQALVDYTRAIKLKPKYANPYGGRGLTYYYLQNYPLAIQDFDHALELDPSITCFKSEREDAYRKLQK